MEENPILKMLHLEAASILLVGPTLKKYNDRGMHSEVILILSLRYVFFVVVLIDNSFLL